MSRRHSIVGELPLAGARRLVRRARHLAALLTTSGWIVLIVVVLAAGAGAWWASPELLAVAILGSFCLLSAVVAIWRPLRVEAQVELTSATEAGHSSRAVVRATKRGRTVSRGLVVAIPTRRAGDVRWAYGQLPDMHPDERVQHPISLAPVERGVVEVGPVGARRTDPLGLLARHQGWTGISTMFVRPRMIEVEGITSGNVRDLDGAPSENVTLSDLAFHALREYVPGDDLRHVHWRSSARAGVLHVRQFHDSRQAHVVVVVDDHVDSYPRPVDFELALSVAASITARLSTENQAVTYACGTETITGPVDVLLDATCRAALTTSDGLVDAAARAARSAPGASQVVLVSGVRSDAARLQSTRELFGGESHFLGIATGRPHQDTDQKPVAGSGGPPMLNVRRMIDLPGALLAEGVGE